MLGRNSESLPVEAAIVSVAGVRNGELVRQRLAPVHELAHLTVEVR